MLNEKQTLKALSDRRQSVAFDIEHAYTNTSNTANLNRLIFDAALQPVPPPLTFFEQVEDGAFALKSLFDVRILNYTLVPFGMVNEQDDENTNEFGMSYNVFNSALPLQSYTICHKNTGDLPGRVTDQNKYFKEYGADTKWSAGHLIAHTYTPEFRSSAKASTRVLGHNFIPEPHYWNCYQRSHLEKRCDGKFYGIYPVYSMRYIHGRTIEPYKDLPYRPVPDGIFFSGYINKTDRLGSVFAPFVAPNYSLFDTSYRDAGAYSTKLERFLKEHKVNYSAVPQTKIIDFSERNLASTLSAETAECQRLAVAQGELFPVDSNEALHHAAALRFERAAVTEIQAPNNKMRCVLLFNQLQNKPKTKLYLKALNEHAKVLLDKCEAEHACKDFDKRIFKDFKKAFKEEEECCELLTRLVVKYSS